MAALTFLITSEGGRRSLGFTTILALPSFLAPPPPLPFARLPPAPWPPLCACPPRCSGFLSLPFAALAGTVCQPSSDFGLCMVSPPLASLLAAATSLACACDAWL